MPDTEYDAIVVGAGTKSLVTAMYLSRYAEMSVGVFDGRFDYCAGLDTSEAAAPGFQTDTHASNLRGFYFSPLLDDFPELEDLGLRLTSYPSTVGVVRREDQSAWAVRHELRDPTQEATATALADFSCEEDAATYAQLWEDVGPGTAVYEAFFRTIYSPPPASNELDPFEQALLDYARRPGSLIDERWLHLPPYQAARELWVDDKLVAAFSLHMEAFGWPFDLGAASTLIADFMFMPSHFICKGGTRNIPHAYTQVVERNGGQIFTDTGVKKVIIKGGRAVGVLLDDGTEVRARKLVLSGVNPQSLIFGLIGAEHVSDKLTRKIKALHSGSHLSTTWYTWALHEQPTWHAATKSPDIQEAHWIAVGPDDYDAFRRQLYDRLRGVMPEMAGHLVVWGRHSIADNSRAPEGKHTFSTEQKVVGERFLTERQWLEFKRQHAQDTMNELAHFTSGMTWDNVIGYFPSTPYDVAATHGYDIPGGFVDVTAGQLGKFRPVAELAQYRTPIDALYCTGQSFGNGRGPASSCEGYAAYKAIADDLGLARPWLDKGRPY